MIRARHTKAEALELTKMGIARVQNEILSSIHSLLK